MTEQIIDGTRYYFDESGKQYIADVWDKMFKPCHSIKMRTNKKYKGQNNNKKVLWLKGEKSY